MCFRRAPAGGDDGIAIGGGAEGAARWDIFRRKIAGIVRASAISQRGQATINQRAAAWQKGVGYTFCQAAADSLYKIGGVGGRFVGGSQKTSACLCGLNSVARQGEPDQKIRRRRGTPRGRRHAATLADLLIPTCKGGKKCSRGGEGASP